MRLRCWNCHRRKLNRRRRLPDRAQQPHWADRDLIRYSSDSVRHYRVSHCLKHAHCSEAASATSSSCTHANPKAWYEENYISSSISIRCCGSVFRGVGSIFTLLLFTEKVLQTLFHPISHSNGGSQSTHNPVALKKIWLSIWYALLFARSTYWTKVLIFWSHWSPPQLSILNSASLFGWIFPNFVADKIGPFNMIISFSFAAGVLIFGWLGIVTRIRLIVFCLMQL